MSTAESKDAETVSEKKGTKDGDLENLIDDIVKNVEHFDGVKVLEFLEDGIYLTVYPPQGDGSPITLPLVLKELEEREVEGYDLELLKKVIDEANGRSTKIAEVVVREPVKGMAKVKVSQDKMVAWLTLIPPKHGGMPVTKEEILEAIEAEGIKYGIDDEVIERAMALGDISEELEFAKGLPAIDGLSAKIDYKFAVHGIEIKPKELENGKVDFYNLNLVQNVTNGQVLATKSMPTLGTDGINVLGTVIKAKPGKDIQIKAGKNTELIDDKTTLIATDDGHVTYSSGKVSVLPVYEVNGDVNFATGNIDFIGGVIVKGNVLEGFSVKAEGDVEVRGSITGGSVHAQGHVQVKNGIIAKDKGVVEATGNLFVKFVENGNINVEGDIVVGEAIMHSKINCKGSIAVGGRKGLIVGGVVRAGDVISAKLVGSNLATATELEAGIDPEIKIKFNSVTQALKEAKVNLEKTQQAFKLLKEMEQKQGGLPTNKKAMLVKVSRAQYQLMGAVQKLSVEQQELQQELEHNTKGKISVSGLIHPGVKITIGPSSYYVKDETQFCSFVREGGEIHCVPLK